MHFLGLIPSCIVFFKERGNKSLNFYFDKKGANMGGLGHERKTKLPEKAI
jgi:hypothetical protein